MIGDHHAVSETRLAACDKMAHCPSDTFLVFYSLRKYHTERTHFSEYVKIV